MKIAGQATVDATPEAIWPLLFDPGTLLKLLPGCDEIEQVAPDEFRARLTLPVAAVAGVYDARVRILEAEAPTFCRVDGEASGAGGSVRGAARFTVAPEGPGSRIKYDADALISGPLAGMNPRFAEGVAHSLIGQGLARLPDLVRERQAAADQAHASPPAPAPAGGWAWLRLALLALLDGLRSWWGSVRSRLRGRG